MNEFDLTCQTCNAPFIGRDNRKMTMEAARTAGWHIYIGDNYIRTATMDVVLCKECVGSPRTQGTRKPSTLEGDQHLW